MACKSCWPPDNLNSPSSSKCPNVKRFKRRFRCGKLVTFQICYSFGNQVWDVLSFSLDQDIQGDAERMRILIKFSFYAGEDPPKDPSTRYQFLRMLFVARTLNGKAKYRTLSTELLISWRLKYSFKLCIVIWLVMHVPLPGGGGSGFTCAPIGACLLQEDLSPESMLVILTYHCRLVTYSTHEFVGWADGEFVSCE